MGRIANIHLAKLWDFMVFYNLNSGDHSVDILEAFLECDEALSELQDQCEHWKTMYGNACGDQDVLKESIRLLDTENRRLMAENKDQKKEIEQRRKEADGLYKALDLLRDEKECLKQKVRDQEKEYKSLQGLNLDIITKRNEDMSQLREENEELKKQNEARRHVIDDFVDTVSGKDNELQDLQRENDELKKDCAYMTHSRDTWRARAKHAEAEVEELKKKLDLTQHAYNGACKDRNCKAEAVVKLAKRRDELQEENDELKKKLNVKQDTIDNLRKSCATAFDEGHAGGESYGYSHMWDAIQTMLSMPHDQCRKYFGLPLAYDVLKCGDYRTIMAGYREFKKDCDTIVEYTRLKDKVRHLEEYTDYLETERNTWRDRAEVSKKEVEELKAKVPDAKEEYEITFTVSEANHKAILNLLSSKAFGASPEYMRDSLKEFCDGRYFCQGCPLRFSNCNFDFMSDEDLEKYYKIAIDAQSETEKPDLTFGDIVKAPWSDDDYIFIETLTSSVRLYNVPKKRFAVISKNEHLKRVGRLLK